MPRESLAPTRQPTRWVPESWYLREMTGKDYGIDYQIEPFEACMATPLRTAVQLKGTRSPRYADGKPRFSISTRHLATYVDAEVLPVFLVLVDVDKNAAYYRFLQQYALTALRTLAWRDQESVTIEFDPDDRVTDSKRLRNALARAQAYMSGLRPGSIGAALAAQAATRART
jgi:hypothetical protein